MFKLFNKRLIATTISAIILSGCTTTAKMPKETPDKYEYPKIEENVVKEWELRQNPITYIDADVNFGIERRKVVPDNIREINIRGLSVKTDGTLKTLAKLLEQYGINVFISDPEIAEKSFEMNNFNGNFGELIDLVEEAYDLSFNYSGKKNIVLKDKSIFIAPVPQDEDSASDLVSAIESLGASDTSFSLAGGFMIYQASNSTHEAIQEYLVNFYKNFAIIKLQVAVITVNIENEKNTGFDWSKLQALIGNSSLLDVTTAGGAAQVTNNLINDFNDGDNGNGNNDGGNNNGDDSNTRTDGKAVGINSEELKFAYLDNNSDIQGAFNLLNTYGATNATQSIFLETISGKELELKSGKEVPYTSNINSTINSVNQNTASLSGFGAQREEEGLTVNFKPYFNYNKNTVTLGLDLELKTITGFKQLNAGNGNGSAEQPITQQQEFNSVVEIRPGEAHLVGGITFTLDSDNRNNLNFLGDLPTASKKDKYSKNALFILLRPTVAVYSDFNKGGK